MGKAVGGYMPRGERTQPQPDKEAAKVPRCSYCHARINFNVWPHFCKELTFGTYVPQIRFLPITEEE